MSDNQSNDYFSSASESKYTHLDISGGEGEHESHSDNDTTILQQNCVHIDIKLSCFSIFHF